MNKFMRVMIFFDLPVKTPWQRHEATKFRNFLIKDGFSMMQWSVYTRICNGMDSVETHRRRVKENLPAKGSVRLLTLTEKQFENMEVLLGTRAKSEDKKQTATFLEF